MRRRGVGLLIASVMALGTPGRLGAQAPRRLPVIGVLGAGTEATWAPWTEAFLRRLEELGWTDGRNVAIAYRWAQGRSDAIASITAEFVRIPVDVIVTVGGAAQIAMRSTSTIPIVFAIAVEPVGIGLVASLSRPGGNLTGLSLQGSDLAGKRIEILREAVPGLRRIAIIANTGSAANLIEVREARAAAASLGLDTDLLGIREAADIAPGFAAMPPDTRALYVSPDPLVNANLREINARALAARLPTIHPFREYLGGDGLLSYGPNTADMFRRAADYVDRILRGARPGDLPVEQPTRFELVINLRAADKLALSIPQALLQRADEVID